jgi:hypothetical protein
VILQNFTRSPPLFFGLLIARRETGKPVVAGVVRSGFLRQPRLQALQLDGSAADHGLIVILHDALYRAAELRQRRRGKKQECRQSNE